MHTGFWWGNLRERNHLEELGVDGWIILKWIFKKWDRSLDWTGMVQDRDKLYVNFSTLSKSL